LSYINVVLDALPVFCVCTVIGTIVVMDCGVYDRCKKKKKEEEQKETVGRNQTRVNPVVAKRLSLAHVQKVVDTDKVEKLEKSTAAHRTAAIQNIQAREKKADARVRQRLRDRRQQKLKNQKKSEHSTKVVPVATAPPNTKKYDPTLSAIPLETTLSQKDIDALRQSIHDKIGSVQKLQMIFGKLDQDKSLTLSPPEFKRLIGSVMRPPPTDAVFKAIWQDVCHLRKSGDGVNEVDFETFKAWLDFES